MNDLSIRLFAFDWLKSQIEIHGDILTRRLLQEGFSLSGENYGLVGPQGIWKPKSMKLPISITSILDGPYPDSIDEKSGLLNYKYRGTNPNHPDNVGLREMMRQNIPLIYLHNIVENKYVPMWPVYIVADNPDDLSFSVMADDIAYIKTAEQSDQAVESLTSYARRAYITVTSLRRVHQKGFRETVLRAYKNQCALCRLRHPELLDAAHIIGDLEDNGEPIIQNGLSLCKIHHVAFDQYIIGINPDYKVKVRKDILEEIDGPMLKYGLQSLDNGKLILPGNLKDYPDKVRLDFRFNQFLKAC
jgi:putative restriction endonuclease